MTLNKDGRPRKKRRQTQYKDEWGVMGMGTRSHKFGVWADKHLTSGDHRTINLIGDNELP